MLPEDSVQVQELRETTEVRDAQCTVPVENNFVGPPTSEGESAPPLSPSLTLKSVGLVVVCGLMILPMSNDRCITPCSPQEMKNEGVKSVKQEQRSLAEDRREAGPKEYPNPKN